MCGPKMGFGEVAEISREINEVQKGQVAEIHKCGKYHARHVKGEYSNTGG